MWKLRLATLLTRILHLGLSTTIAALAIDRITHQHYGPAPTPTILAVLAGVLDVGASVLGGLGAVGVGVPVVAVAVADAASVFVDFVVAATWTMSLAGTDCNTRWTSNTWIRMSQNPLLNLGAFPSSSSPSPAYGYMQLPNPRRVLREVCYHAVAVEALLIVAVFVGSGALVLGSWARRRVVMRRLRRVWRMVGEEKGWWERGYVLLEAVRREEEEESEEEEEEEREEEEVYRRRRGDSNERERQEGDYIERKTAVD